jgi:hypothetical protein
MSCALRRRMDRFLGTTAANEPAAVTPHLRVETGFSQKVFLSADTLLCRTLVWNGKCLSAWARWEELAGAFVTRDPAAIVIQGNVSTARPDHRPGEAATRWHGSVPLPTIGTAEPVREETAAPARQAAAMLRRIGDNPPPRGRRSQFQGL